MVLRTAISVLCLLLPAAAAGQVAYAEDQTLVTTGAAELLYLVDADGDGDLDVWAGPETAGGPIDLHEQSGPGAFTARALTVPEATYTHWAPCAANVDAFMDVCYGNSAATRIHYVRAAALGTLNATSVFVNTADSSNVRSLRPLKLAAVIGDQFAYATSSLGAMSADPTASITTFPTTLNGVLDVRTGDVDGDGNGDIAGLRAGDVQLTTNGGGLGVWNAALTFGVPGAVDATIADLVAGGSRELVIVTSSGTAFLVADAGGAGTVSQLLGVQNAVAVTTLDADLDGDLDLAFAVRPLGIGAGVEIWENGGAGAFTLVDAVSTAGGTDVPTAIAAGDLVDADGKPELALALGGLTHQVVIFAGANLPPRITATGALPSPVPEGDPVTLSATASTPELGQALTYQFFDWTGANLGLPSASSSLVITAPRICGATAGATQTLTYRVEVSDGVAPATSAPITLTVSEALNDPPIIDSFTPPASMNELATITVGAVAHDADCPGGPLTYSFIATGLSAVPNGADQVDLTASARICAPSSGQLRVRVTDVLGAFVETLDQTITINDTLDDPPILAAITPAGPLAEGATGTFTISLAQVDDCPGQLAYAWTLPSELTLVSGQGTDQLQVTANRICGTQTVSLSVNVSDAGSPAGVPASLLLTLTEAINDPPVLDSFPLPASINELATITVGAVGHDTDCPGDPVTYTFTATGLDAVANGADQVDLTATGRICAPGSAQVRVRVTDVLGAFVDSLDQSITVNDTVDDVAELGAITPGGPLAEGGQRTLTVALAADDCPGQLVYDWILPGELTILSGQGTSQVEVAAGRFCGDRTITLTVRVADALNPVGVPAALSLDLTEGINDPPIIDSFTPSGSIDEGATISVPVVAHDPDCPLDPLTYLFTPTNLTATPDVATGLSEVQLTATGRICAPADAWVRVRVTDASNDFAETPDLPITINDSWDDPPLLGPITGDPPVEGETSPFSVTVIDDCSSQLVYSWTAGAGLTIEAGQAESTVVVRAARVCAEQRIPLGITVTDATDLVGDSGTLEVVVANSVHEYPIINEIRGSAPSLDEATSLAGTFTLDAIDPDCGPFSVQWSVSDDASIPGPTDGLSVTLDTHPVGCLGGSATLTALVTDDDQLPATRSLVVPVDWINDAPELAIDPPELPTSLNESEQPLWPVFSVAGSDDCSLSLGYEWSAAPDLLEFIEPAEGQATAALRQPLCGDQVVQVTVEISDEAGPALFGPYDVALNDDVPSAPSFAGMQPVALMEHESATIRVRVLDPECPVTAAPPSELACVASIPGVPVDPCQVEQELADEHFGTVVVDIPSLEGSCPGESLAFELQLAVALSGPYSTPVDGVFVLPVVAVDDAPVFGPLPPTSAPSPIDPLLIELTAPAVSDDGCSLLTYAWSIPPRITLLEATTGSLATVRNELAAGAPDSLRCETTALVQVTVTDGAGGESTSADLELTVPSLDVRPPQNARFEPPDRLFVDVTEPLVLRAHSEDDCPGLSFFRFTTGSPLVTLLPGADGFSVTVTAAACNLGGPAEIVATPTDGVQDGVADTLPLQVIAAPATLQSPPPLLLILDGSPIDAPVVVDATCVPEVCFEPLADQPTAPLQPEAGDGCGGPARRLRIPAEALSAFLPPHDRLGYDVKDPSRRAETVRVDVQLVPSDDLLRLSHSTDRGRLGPGETATLTVEIASRLLGPIEVPVVIEDSLLGLSLVEGTARITGATLVEAIGTGGGAEFTVTDLPPAGGTATLTFLVTRSLASDGVVTSSVIARAVDHAPLSRRDGTAAAGLDLGAAPGIACSCASGGAEGGGFALLGLVLAALLAAPRTRLPRRPQTR